ncbi:hypothetical protein Tco_0429660, partial [Tanacetum coccineum]
MILSSSTEENDLGSDLKYVESLEDELDELESDKAEFSNMYDMLLQECVSKDVMCSYLQSSSDLDEITELQCLYLHKVRECDCLAQKLSEQTEFVSKEIYTELLQSFARLENTHTFTLYKCELHPSMEVWRGLTEDKDNFELKGQFIKELRTNTFSGSDHEDANEHIEKVLEIV